MTFDEWVKTAPPVGHGIARLAWDAAIGAAEQACRDSARYDMPLNGLGNAQSSGCSDCAKAVSKLRTRPAVVELKL